VSQNLETVSAFVDAFNRNDLDRIMAFFAPDAVYHNMPLQPVRGTQAIRGVIQGFMGMASRVDWVVRHAAETKSGVVLNERLDRFLIADKWVELPVMGSFEIEGGKIKSWRDYFDMQQFQSQLPGARS
jgi:limonene-1,2-epoxide hydrolase